MTQPFNSTLGVGLWQDMIGPQGTVRSILGSSSGSAGIATDTNVRYVDPGGSDATGDGSRAQPFRTVQPAIAACVAAGATAANPFVVRVSPGAGFGTFTLAPSVYVQGSGSGSGNYNGSPLTGVTYLDPDASQLLDATWAGAEVQTSGLANAAITTDILADFLAIGSGAGSSLFLQNLVTENAISVIGSGNAEWLTAQGVYLNAQVDFTLTNLGGCTMFDCVNDFGGPLKISQSAAIVSFYSVALVAFAGLQASWTSADINNFMVILLGPAPFNDMNDGLFSSITGAGVVVVAPGSSCTNAMADADQRLAFGNNVSTDIHGVVGALNVVSGTPSANRTLTIERPTNSSRVTEIVVCNQAAATFSITVAFPAGTVAPGTNLVVAAASARRYLYDLKLNLWLSA